HDQEQCDSHPHGNPHHARCRSDRMSTTSASRLVRGTGRCKKGGATPGYPPSAGGKSQKIRRTPDNPNISDIPGISPSQYIGQSRENNMEDADHDNPIPIYRTGTDNRHPKIVDARNNRASGHRLAAPWAGKTV